MYTLLLHSPIKRGTNERGRPMAADWIMVRLKRTTHARLLWVRQLLVEMQESGKASGVRRHEESGEIPLDALVTYVLDHYFDYRCRPRTKQTRGKRARPSVDVGANPVDVPKPTDE